MSVTTNTELSIVEQVTQLPTPQGMFGENIKAELDKTVRMLRDVPQVETDADCEILESTIKKAQKAVKYAGDRRLSITRIFDTFKGGYMQAEKDFLIELAPELQSAINRVTAYQRKKLQDRRDAEAKVIADREKEAARKRSETSIAAVETAKQNDLAQIAETQVLTGVATIWRAEVTNAAEVPRKYLVVDQKLIDADVKQGVRSIPGVAITEDVRRTGR
jgi:hypothetical protein